ncbi:hypothetical protein B0H67DRAFT_306685 [Lasiosphaeris hirsuta]|uniref:Uncharacterized protein n=1 Tax=Lasiosphaeris hirsuta TaxID=260670 RepID=A0AA40DST4_9PEZI|nr:hypothetical protein B0H67DRAFT_306685 [Lasiosphaeris hirsuta]
MPIKVQPLHASQVPIKRSNCPPDPYLRIRDPKIAERQRGRPKNTPKAIPVAMLLPMPDPKTPDPRTPRRSTPKSASAKAKRNTPKSVKAGAPRPLRQSARRELSQWERNLSEDDTIPSGRSGVQGGPIQISEDEDQEEDNIQGTQEGQGIQEGQGMQVQGQGPKKARGRLRGSKNRNTKATIANPPSVPEPRPAPELSPVPRSRLVIKPKPRSGLMISGSTQEPAATEKRRAPASLEPPVIKRTTRSGREVRPTARALRVD